MKKPSKEERRREIEKEFEVKWAQAQKTEGIRVQIYEQRKIEETIRRMFGGSGSDSYN